MTKCYCKTAQDAEALMLYLAFSATLCNFMAEIRGQHTVFPLVITWSRVYLTARPIVYDARLVHAWSGFGSVSSFYHSI